MRTPKGGHKTNMDNQEENIQEELSKVNINGQEYDPTEAQELIDYGRKTKEAEQKYNITFDSIMPAYTKANERAKQADQYETELSEAREQLKTFQSKQERGTETQEDFTEAKEAARKLGIPLREDLDKEGYIKRDDLDKYLSDRDQRQSAVNAILKEAEDLEGKFNGEDGRPRFNKKVVLAYAQAYGSESLQAAYEDMHADALSRWQKEQVDSQRKPGLKTLASQPGNKQPSEVKLTKDNVGDLLSESLWGK